MKTIEFKITPTQVQEAIINTWLESLRSVWNRGLSLLEDFDSFLVWNKLSKQYVPCSPLPWEYRWYEEAGQWKRAAFCRITVRARSYCMACPIPQPHRTPALKNTSYFSLCTFFAHKRHPNKPSLKAIPANFIRGTLQSLAKAWEAYKSGECKSPRYKGRKDPIGSLINNDAKTLSPEGKYLSITKLGCFKVRHLEARWPEQTPICTLKVCKRASGYYLQLTGNLLSKQVIKPSNKAVGVAFDLKAHHTTDTGKSVAAPQYLAHALKQLVRLQRKAARQQFGSTNQAKTYQKISRLHERVRLRRRNFNHKLSTYLVRSYGAIALQVCNRRTKIHKSKPKIVKGKYIPNGREYRRTLNLRLLDLGTGHFVNFVKYKALIAGREVTEVPLSKEFEGSPTEAARTILAEGLMSFARIYRQCGREVKPVKDSETGSVQQEPGQPGHPGEVGTTPLLSECSSSRASKPQSSSRSREPSNADFMTDINSAYS